MSEEPRYPRQGWIEEEIRKRPGLTKGVIAKGIKRNPTTLWRIINGHARMLQSLNPPETVRVSARAVHPITHLIVDPLANA